MCEGRLFVPEALATQLVRCSWVALVGACRRKLSDPSVEPRVAPYESVWEALRRSGPDLLLCGSLEPRSYIRKAQIVASSKLLALLLFRTKALVGHSAQVMQLVERP